jgi:hypothetical protein
VRIGCVNESDDQALYNVGMALIGFGAVWALFALVAGLFTEDATLLKTSAAGVGIAGLGATLYASAKKKT